MSDAARSGKGPVAYRGLAEQLREGILAKAFPDGRLPTEAELARTYGLSRQTVQRAMQELVASGCRRESDGCSTGYWKSRNPACEAA